MPINVFGNNSNFSDKKIDTSLFVQKPYLRTNYIESNIEEDIDLKNQFRIKILPDPISIREPASKNYVDNLFNHPSIIKNNAHINLNDRNVTNIRFLQVNQLPQIDSHLTAKLYVDNAISDSVDESSLLRLGTDENLTQDTIVLNSTYSSPKTILEIPTKNCVDNKFNNPSIIKNTDHVDFNDKILDNVHSIKVNSYPTLDAQITPNFYVNHFVHDYVDEASLLRLDPKEMLHLDGKLDSIFLNSSLASTGTIIDIPTKSYVDSLHESSRNRRDLSLVFNDQDNEFDNIKLINLDSITVNRIPSSANELSSKKYVDDSIGEGTIVRFCQTLENYLKVSVGNDTYNLTNYNKIQFTDTTIIKYANIGSDLLQKWNIKCNNKKNSSKVEDFIQSTKTNSPTGYSGATSLTPIGNSFMYIETSSNNHGHERVFVSFERTDIVQISSFTYYYNRFSILNDEDRKSMGRFRIQLLLEDNTWSTQYTIAKNGHYSNTSTDWKLLNLDFTLENYGIKFIYDQIDTPHADICFSIITMTHSVY